MQVVYFYKNLMRIVPDDDEVSRKPGQICLIFYPSSITIPIDPRRPVFLRWE